MAIIGLYESIVREYSIAVPEEWKNSLINQFDILNRGGVVYSLDHGCCNFPVLCFSDSTKFEKEVLMTLQKQGSAPSIPGFNSESYFDELGKLYQKLVYSSVSFLHGSGMGFRMNMPDDSRITEIFPERKEVVLIGAINHFLVYGAPVAEVKKVLRI